MKTMPSHRDSSDYSNTTYGLVEELFGSSRVDEAYFSITHPQY